MFYSPFLSQIGQNLTGEFMWKISAASGNLFTDSWSWQSFVSSYYVFTVVLHLIYTMKYVCYQDSFSFHGWHVYWVYGWEMRLSEIIVFKNKLLLVSTYFTLLDAYIESWKVLSNSGLTWWLSGAASRLVSLSNYVSFDVFFSGFMKWSVVYAVTLRTFVRIETMISVT